MFPDYLSVSYDYGLTLAENFSIDEFDYLWVKDLNLLEVVTYVRFEIRTNIVIDSCGKPLLCRLPYR